MTEGPELLIYTTYRLQANDVEPFQALAMRMGAAARKSDGCAFLDVTQDVGDPGIFRLVEGWHDQAALDAHSASAEFKAQLKEAKALAIIDRSINVYPVVQKRTGAMPI